MFEGGLDRTWFGGGAGVGAEVGICVEWGLELVLILQ